MADYLPTSGSCPKCQAALGLAALKAKGTWYCSSACVEGAAPSQGAPKVPEAWLYHRPRRFLNTRAPKELKKLRT